MGFFTKDGKVHPTNSKGDGEIHQREKDLDLNIKNYKKRNKLISDSERRTIEQRGSEEWRADHSKGNYPDDNVKRSADDIDRNYRIQLRGKARDELDKRSKNTRRDNPKTPLQHEVPFGKDSRPQHDKIAGSLLEQDTRDSHLALDYTDEENPISRPEKPHRRDWTRIIHAEKGFKGIIKKQTTFVVAEHDKPEFVEVTPVKDHKRK